MDAGRIAILCYIVMSVDVAGVEAGVGARAAAIPEVGV